MIKLLNKLPNSIYIAFSGGVDSTAAVDFLSKKHNVTCVFFHHGTGTSDKALEFVTTFCYNRNLPLLISYNTKSKCKFQSWEEFWRVERYKFFHKLPGVVVTAHTLDDCIETYIFNMLHGRQQTIAANYKNVVRPFLTTLKSDFRYWCNRRNVIWSEDETNSDTKFMRNYIRHDLVPKALVVNPGLYKTVKKLVLNSSL